MSLLERILTAIIAILVVAALVGLIKLDIGQWNRPGPASGIIKQPTTR